MKSILGFLLVNLVIAIQMGLLTSTVMPMGNVLVALVILVQNALNAKVVILKNKVDNAQVFTLLTYF